MVDARLTNQEKRVEHDEEKGDIKPTVRRLALVEVGDQNAQSNEACGSEECGGTTNGCEECGRTDSSMLDSHGAMLRELIGLFSDYFVAYFLA